MAETDRDGGLVLDRVAPPSGCADPTLVVWRRLGWAQDRWIVRGSVMFLYLVVIGILALAGLRRWDAWTMGVDGTVLGIGVGQAWLMSNPRVYYAAGETWIANWSDGLLRRPSPAGGDGEGVLRFLELTGVELRRESRGSAVISLVRADGTKLGFFLQPLQSCPDLLAVIERALDGPQVAVPAEVRSVLHARPQVRDLRGRTAVRPGYRP